MEADSMVTVGYQGTDYQVPKSVLQSGTTIQYIQDQLKQQAVFREYESFVASKGSSNYWDHRMAPPAMREWLMDKHLQRKAQEEAASEQQTAS